MRGRHFGTKGFRLLAKVTVTTQQIIIAGVVIMNPALRIWKRQNKN